jgi:hypothetical protein
MLLATRAEVCVRVLEPVDPPGFGQDVERLRDHVRSRILEERQSLCLSRAKPSGSG